MTKSEQDGNHPASHYLVVEDPEHPSTWHLRVRDTGGAVNHTLMGAAWAALYGGYRGNKYEGPGKEEALRKLKALYKSEGMELPGAESSELSVISYKNQNSEPRTQNLELKTYNLELQNSARHLAVLLNGPGRPIADRHEIPIAVIGSWVKDGHKLSITANDLAAMVRNFEKRKNDQVVIDYEHASENPEVARGGAIPAAGWIHELTLGPGPGTRDPVLGSNNNGDGQILYALVEWTPEAKAMIKSGQYRFFSPAIDWHYADKTTGGPQGATLTSGALTNHPFLEELPPIMLSDLAADVSGYLDAPLKNVSVAYPGPGSSPGERGKFNGGTFNGGTMLKSTKLSVKKMEGDDFEGARGHHGIFDGDDYVGHVPADEMRDHVESCMEDGFGDLDDLLAPDKNGKAKGQAGVKGHQEPDGDEKMSELLRESGFTPIPTLSQRERANGAAREGAIEQIRGALKLAATYQLVERREAARTLLLAECCRAGPCPGHAAGPWFLVEKAKILLRDGKITAADLLDAIEAKDALSDAIAKGKVLPKDHAFFFEIALNNPKKFADYIAGAVPVVRLGTVGLGSAAQLPVDEEVDVETKKLMSEKKLSYGKAMKELFRSNPALEGRYRAAHRQQPRSDSPAADHGSAGVTQ